MARNRRKRNGASDKTTGAILFALGTILLVALAAGAWWLRKTKVQLDAENCPVEGPRAIHMIMIDRSDPVSPQQAQRVRQYVHKAKDDAIFGTRFDVYTFEGDVKNELRPILRVCAPGRPEDANELIANPDMIRRTYVEKFSAVLDKTIDDLLTETTRSNSPIIESLKAAAISSFGPAEAGKVPLRLTLISDMVQHTTPVSHFRATPDFSVLSKTMPWATLRPPLRGAEITILYLLRQTAVRGAQPVQNRGHQLFWEQLIAASNGHLKAIDPI